MYLYLYGFIRAVLVGFAVAFAQYTKRPLVLVVLYTCMYVRLDKNRSVHNTVAYCQIQIATLLAVSIAMPFSKRANLFALQRSRSET